MGIDLGNRKGIKLGCKHVDNVLIQFNMRSKPNHATTSRFPSQLSSRQTRTNSYNWLLLRIDPFALRFPPQTRSNPSPRPRPNSGPNSIPHSTRPDPSSTTHIPLVCVFSLYFLVSCQVCASCLCYMFGLAWIALRCLALPCLEFCLLVPCFLFACSFICGS